MINDINFDLKQTLCQLENFMEKSETLFRKRKFFIIVVDNFLALKPSKTRLSHFYFFYLHLSLYESCKLERFS